MTTYLCDVLDKPVWNAQGQRIGRCLDLLVTEVERGFPPLRALAVRRGGEDLLVPADEVAWLSPSVLLNSTDPPRTHRRAMSSGSAARCSIARSSMSKGGVSCG